MSQLSDTAGRLEQMARALIGSVLFDRIARNVGIEGAIRAAYHRLLAEQHQERVPWQNKAGHDAAGPAPLAPCKRAV